MDKPTITDISTPTRGRYDGGTTGKRGKQNEYSRGLKLIESDDQNRKRVERRIYKRFLVKKNAFAIIRSTHTPILIRSKSKR